MTGRRVTKLLFALLCVCVLMTLAIPVVFARQPTDGNFALLRQAPAEPALIAPPDDSVAVSKTSVLSWEPYAGALKYSVKITTSGTGFGENAKLKRALAAKTSYKLKLKDYMYYTWQVCACADKKCKVEITCSDTWNLRAPYTPKPIKKLIAPKNGAKNVSFEPVFNWTPAAPVGVIDYYELQITGLPLIMVAAPDVSYVLPAEQKLAPNTRYTWKMRASNDLNLCSKWSKARKFTTAVRATPTPTKTRTPTRTPTLAGLRSAAFTPTMTITPTTTPVTGYAIR